MNEKELRLLVNFYRLIKFYEFDDKHKGNTNTCDDVLFFYEVAVELANTILKSKEILPLSTDKTKKFAEVIRYLMQEETLEEEVVNVYLKFFSKSISEDEKTKLNSNLRDKNFIEKYKGL